jgi:hypothetical protein
MHTRTHTLELGMTGQVWWWFSDNPILAASS